VIQKLIEIAKEAGEEILKVYHSDNVNTEFKFDGSPLTLADKLANDIIVNNLKICFPEIPILSEEEKSIDYEARKNWNAFFLVDPLDGTKEFIKKNGEFTVNIAYIENGIPVAGVVLAPVLKKIYCGSPEKGLQIFEYSSTTQQLIQSEKNTSSSDKLRIVASRSHNNQETEDFIEEMRQKFNEIEIVSMGSSLKICLVAEGMADVYPRLGPTMEWDTAAAHAVIIHAKGTLTEFETGKPLTYNKQNLLNPHFIVRK